MICFGLLRPSFQKLELLGEQTWGLGVEGGVGGRGGWAVGGARKAAEDALVEIFGFTRTV